MLYLPYLNRLYKKAGEVVQESLIVLDVLYDWRLVLFSVTVAIVGSYVALEINTRLTMLHSSKNQFLWMGIGAVTMGVSIWSMHFIAMSAFQLYVPLTYNWWLTAFSVLPAIIAAFTAFFVLHRTQLRALTILAAGLFMGFGIVAMHYSGMHAVTFAGVVTHSPALVITASTVAVVVSFAALLLFTLTKNIRSIPIRALVASVMGLAIASMHYTGMAGTDFCLPAGMSSLIQPEPVSSTNVFGATTLFTAGTIFVAVQFILYSENRWFNRMTFTDAATGLANRRQLEGLSAASLQRFGAACALEINDMKDWSLHYGYAAADRLTKQAAEVLQRRLPLQAELYKTEDNRFTVFLPEAPILDLREWMAELAQPVRAELPESNQIMELTFSAGAACAADKKPLAELLQELDHALRTALRMKRDIVFYDEDAAEQAREERIIQELRHAISGGTLEAYYQVKVDLQTMRAEKAEALARWTHPELGMISPGEFIPAAERAGLIVPLTEYMLHRVCRQLLTWDESGVPVREAALNLSPVHFQAVGANERIQDIVSGYGIDPGRIELEITETAMMRNLETAVAQMEELRAFGFRLALDDFGNGLSSLTYLQQLPVHTLKIDRSFISRLTRSPEDQAIVKLMIDFAATTGLHVVCEGIESREELLALRLMGCHDGQGFLFQRPVPASEITVRYDLDLTS